MADIRVANDPQIVTVQQLTPLLVALLRGIILALVGGVSGVIAVLQTDGDASVRKLLVGGFVAGGLAFVSRVTEGLVDQNRAVTVDSSAPVSDAMTSGTAVTGV